MHAKTRKPTLKTLQILNNDGIKLMFNKGEMPKSRYFPFSFGERSKKMDKSRLEDLLQDAMYGLIEDDETEALIYFRDTMHMTAEEIEGNKKMDKSRLEDLLQYAIWGLIDDDKTEALIYFRDTMRMTEEECDIFGINYKEMMEVK